MRERSHFVSWRTLAALGAVLLLLFLAVHPTATATLAVAILLLPVTLFGLLPAAVTSGTNEGHEARVFRPVLVRARLFQRPPPLSIL